MTSARERAAAVAVFLLALAPVAWLTHGAVFLAGNDASRFAAIESLVERHTAAIEHSSFAWTVDRVELGGHLYSNKPPLVALLGAACYAPLHALGLSFAPASRAATVRTLTILLSGIPTALVAALLYGALALFPAISTGRRVLVALATVFGTTLLPYATTLSGHTLAAALLFGSFAASARGRGARSGAFAGLAASVDTLASLGLAPALLFIAWRCGGRRAAARFALGLAFGALVYAAANLATVGSILPPKVAPGARDWTQAAGPAAAGTQIPPGRQTYVAEGLLGGQGFLTTSPIVVFGIAGLVVAARRGLVLGRSAAAVLLLACGAQVIGRCLFPALAGGWSWGFRYLVPLLPILMFFAPAALGGARTAAFAALLPVSVALALLGAWNPWPPVREHVRVQDPVIEGVSNPVGASLAALLEDRVPKSRVAEWAGARFVSPDPDVRRRWFAYFFATKGDEERCRRYDPAVADRLP